MPHPPCLLQMSKIQTQTIESETKELLEKGVMRVDDTSGEFLSNMLLVKRKTEELFGDNTPKFERIHTLPAFRNKELCCLKYLFEKHFC